ncbi:MAG: hypothetical protein JWO33_252 [Caulobacteraceae bacterium]|nr:hypothetical protein [Caulobacteraceae bacterium]
MAADFAARPASSAAVIAQPVASGEPEAALSRRAPAWRPWAGGLLAVGLSAVTLVQLSHASSEALATVQRLSPVAWSLFAVLYLVQPLADLLIFRRLWRLPITSFGVMLRKVVINETLFGYGGELYFYLWARRRPGLSDAPFGAIKDVNVVSALGANVLTLIMLLVSAAGLERVDLAHQFGPAFWPGLGLIALSFGVLLFARRVFSLTRRELTAVAAIHAVRLAATGGLTVLLWRSALPDVALGVWLALLAGRLLLARLPFVANKDLMFANLILVLFGATSPTALLLATLAIVTLTAHLAVILLVGSPDLWRAMRNGNWRLQFRLTPSPCRPPI